MYQKIRGNRRAFVEGQGIFDILKRTIEKRRKNRMKAYGLLLLAAIVCALFSDQIDKIFAMDNQLKKVLLFFRLEFFWFA